MIVAGTLAGSIIASLGTWFVEHRRQVVDRTHRAHVAALAAIDTLIDFQQNSYDRAITARHPPQASFTDSSNTLSITAPRLALRETPDLLADLPLGLDTPVLDLMRRCREHDSRVRAVKLAHDAAQISAETAQKWYRIEAGGLATLARQAQTIENTLRTSADSGNADLSGPVFTEIDEMAASGRTALNENAFSRWSSAVLAALDRCDSFTEISETPFQTYTTFSMTAAWYAWSADPIIDSSRFIQRLHVWRNKIMIEALSDEAHGNHASRDWEKICSELLSTLRYCSVTDSQWATFQIRVAYLYKYRPDRICSPIDSKALYEACIHLLSDPREINDPIKSSLFQAHWMTEPPSAHADDYLSDSLNALDPKGLVEQLRDQL